MQVCIGVAGELRNRMPMVESTMKLPAEMAEIAIAAFGDPEVLRPRRVLTPTPIAGELLVRVAAAGVNRAGVLQRMGKYMLPEGSNPTLGLEIAGDVVVVGDRVSSFAVGDRVCGLTNEEAAIADELRARVWPLLGPGRIEPIIHATFPLTHAADAHRLMESNDHIGKIVLHVGG